MDLSRAQWRKSRQSGNNGGHCVEVSALPGRDVTVENKAGEDAVFVVRDSKNRDRAPLVFTRAEWDAFVAGVKNGEFDSAALLAAMRATATL
ncbi:DUF397 domain-containing protein [Marinitenerispora sediminis]|uniref:DUF397 domain-containing protein n=2 Tax=Marinitenerispora sediminis TaxID=1931232 RepID=A0A368T5A7_9ACTN|nr:DUF397 domain-containing protein [Marinitenerispora sediminis]RCV54553.1 DUF397 domain-containing protein [Marinitenerispora sediminis]RCV58795.1 DUF397 domain-containing protein [Marinitenerispora sediminis]